MIAPYTFRLTLDALDDSHAVLVHLDPSGGPSLAQLTLARSTWDDLGRPSQVDAEISERAHG